MPDLLFVYGTLRSGFTNEWALLLRAQARFAGHATVQGALAAVGEYSTFVPGTGGEVEGEIYRLNTPQTTLTALDAYEGGDWARIEIETSGGRAWIYFFRGV